MIVKFFLFFLITLSVSIIIYNLTKNYKVFFDNPNKFHSGKAINVGGLMLIINILVSIKFFEFSEIINNILIYSLALFLLGFLDDLRPVSPTSRIFFQFIIVFFVVFTNNLEISNLGNYKFIGTIELGSISEIFTCLCVLLIINSSNYNDGIDGWSTTTFILSNLFFLLILILLREFNFVTLPIFLVISCLGLLIFNFNTFNSVKVFLGNGGSVLLGYLISFELIYFNYVDLDIHPIIYASILCFYVYEFLSVNLYRILKEKNIFEGGKDHYHYALYYYFSKNIYFTIFWLILSQFLMIAINLLSFYLFGSLLNFITFILLFIIFFLIRSYFIEKSGLLINTGK
tara:strand:+ start:1036 stop:2067 length:1032 start_codon:yes stop_codon:yes gene_type:complete